MKPAIQRIEDTRHTVDIDGNWQSEIQPTGQEMAEPLRNALAKGGIDLDVSMSLMYGEGRSAGFELTDRDTGEILFAMDVDVNRPVSSIKMYEAEDIRFLGVSPSQMIADKISAVSSDKIFRRINDVVDLYYLSKVSVLDKTEIEQVLSDTGRTIEDFNGFLNREDELKHSYEEFRFDEDIEKPPFSEMYQSVKEYIKGFRPAVDE